MKIDLIILLVEYSDENKPTKKGFIDFINRLKSLRHQNHWKPSDEQLEVLREALAHIPDEYDVPSLTEIYEQLKKLRRE